MPLFHDLSQKVPHGAAGINLDHSMASRTAEDPEARSVRLLVKTRRRRYLETHPEYFDAPSLELAGRRSSNSFIVPIHYEHHQARRWQQSSSIRPNDIVSQWSGLRGVLLCMVPGSAPTEGEYSIIPSETNHGLDPLLYDRMVRQFQTANEREEDGKRKGYSGKLEADLMRSEAKVEALAHPDPNSPLVYRRDQQGTIVAVDQNEEDRPASKDQGVQKWRECMEQRFLRGEDADFDYSAVDNNQDYDDVLEETRRHEEAYFDEQEERFIGEGDATGQTGVQDF